MVFCPYCNSEAILESTTKIYSRDYGLAYICKNYPICDAYVGVHKGTDKPLGRLADAELRAWKNKAHAAFDPLWQRRYNQFKDSGGESKGHVRNLGYKWLSEKLHIKKKDCHIGMFDVDLCKRVVEVCKPYIKKNHFRNLSKREELKTPSKLKKQGFSSMAENINKIFKNMENK